MSNEQQQLKSGILELLTAQDPTVLISEADKARLKSMVDALLPFTEVAEPIKEQSKVEGVWASLFASFGAKHSEEKPMHHTSNLAYQSFGKLPKVPAHVTDINQEILAETHAYNNVVFVQNEDRTANAVVLMEGRYQEDPDNPKRYSVSFHNVSLRGADGQSESELHRQFGLDDDVTLSIPLKPPALHSDIVYLDDDMRINFGSLGGFYVLQRLPRAGYSIDYAAA